MMRALYSAVSGLTAHQTKMDVIANNVSNVNTTAYKASRVTFSEVYAETVQSATSPSDNTGGTNPMQIGLGTSVASIDIDMSQGASQRTDNTLDLMISGDGFFVVSDATGYKFTRDGSFSIDSSGYLVTSSGLKVQGWGVDSDGNIEEGEVDDLQILSAENTYIEPTATTAATISGNIDSTDDDFSTGKDISMTVYDSLGAAYTVNMTITETGTDGEYDVTLSSVTDSDGNDVTGSASGTATITFDTATGEVTSSPATFELDLSSIGDSFADTIEVDFSDMTMYSGDTDVEASNGDSDGLNGGNYAGTLTSYEIGTDGIITGVYSNGESKTLGQIVVATFDNAAGLEEVGDNLYTTTNNSGEFDGIGEDITDSGGSINSGVLEMSNVDLATEFTEMITTQRGYQANSRIITTADSLLEELVNLKR